MTIDREVDRNGGIRETIRLTDDENAAIKECHSILEERVRAHGETYDGHWKKMCEWWLLGILRFEGAEKMVDMARNAPFHDKKRLVAVGYAEVKEAQGE